MWCVMTSFVTASPAAVLDNPSSSQQQYVSCEAHTGVALLSKTGREVYLGQHVNKGIITIYDTDTKQVLDVVKVRGA